MSVMRRNDIEFSVIYSSTVLYFKSTDFMEQLFFLSQWYYVPIINNARDKRYNSEKVINST